MASNNPSHRVLAAAPYGYRDNFLHLTMDLARERLEVNWRFYEFQMNKANFILVAISFMFPFNLAPLLGPDKLRALPLLLSSMALLLLLTALFYCIYSMWARPWRINPDVSSLVEHLRSGEVIKEGIMLDVAALMVDGYKINQKQIVQQAKRMNISLILVFIAVFLMCLEAIESGLKLGMTP